MRSNFFSSLVSWFLTSETKSQFISSSVLLFLCVQPTPADATPLVLHLLYSVPCLQKISNYSSFFFFLFFFTCWCLCLKLHILYFWRLFLFFVHIANLCCFKRYIQKYCLKSHFTFPLIFTEWPSPGSAFSEAIKTDRLKRYVSTASTLHFHWVCTVYLCLWNNKLRDDRNAFVHECPIL